jgi:hypothetical protein
MIHLDLVRNASDLRGCSNVRKVAGAYRLREHCSRFIKSRRWTLLTYYERSYSNVWVMPGEPRNLSVSLSVEL